MALSPSMLSGGGLGGGLGDTPIYAPGTGPSVVNALHHPAPTPGEYPFTGHKFVGDLPGWTYDPWADTYYPNSKQYAQYAQKSGLAGASPNLFEQLLPSLLAGTLKGTGASLGSGATSVLGSLGSGVKSGASSLWNYLNGGSPPGDTLGSADSFLGNALNSASSSSSSGLGDFSMALDTPDTGSDLFNFAQGLGDAF